MQMKLNHRLRVVAVLFAVCCLFFTAGGLLSSCIGVQDNCNAYDNPEMWYDDGHEFDSSKADVFYVLPSCVYDWTDPEGVTHHNACVTDSLHRVRMSRAFPIADEIFGDSANFFSPYYRQVTLNAWMMDEQTRDSCLAIALEDVRTAFNWYLENWNGGRPFVLAGFSQGAGCALQLLSEMSPEISERMVAAYIIGYPITQKDIDGSENIRPAQGPDDTGVCIAYTTVSDINAVSPLINGGNEVIINPASWTLDERPHMVNDSVSVRIQYGTNVLIADGVDPAMYVKPKLVNLIPPGNLHLAELELYRDQLRENVKLRIYTNRLRKNSMVSSSEPSMLSAK